jgi:hypothetical protein
VKYPKPVIGNDIIQDFKQVRLSVKTDKQVFVFGIGIIFVEKTVVFDGIKCHPYVYLAHAVFESGGIELYGNVHVSILLQKKRSRNTYSAKAFFESKIAAFIARFRAGGGSMAPPVDARAVCGRSDPGRRNRPGKMVLALYGDFTAKSKHTCCDLPQSRIEPKVRSQKSKRSWKKYKK